MAIENSIFWINHGRFKSFVYSKSPSPDDNRLQNSGFMSLAILSKDYVNKICTYYINECHF